MVGECQALVLEFLISFSLVNSKRYYFFFILATSCLWQHF